MQRTFYSNRGWRSELKFLSLIRGLALHPPFVTCFQSQHIRLARFPIPIGVNKAFLQRQINCRAISKLFDALILLICVILVKWMSCWLFFRRQKVRLLYIHGQQSLAVEQISCPTDVDWGVPSSSSDSLDQRQHREKSSSGCRIVSEGKKMARLCKSSWLDIEHSEGKESLVRRNRAVVVLEWELEQRGEGKCKQRE